MDLVNSEKLKESADEKIEPSREQDIFAIGIICLQMAYGDRLEDPVDSHKSLVHREEHYNK